MARLKQLNHWLLREQVCLSIVWAAAWENLLLPYANNKAADQPTQPRSLISAFVFRCLDSIIPLVPISEISNLYLASVAAQAGLSLPWSQTPKTGFLVTRIRMICCQLYIIKLLWASSRKKPTTNHPNSIDLPRHEKTCLRVLRPGKTRTGLRSHRS